jgi:hypothetical protein
MEEKTYPSEKRSTWNKFNLENHQSLIDKWRLTGLLQDLSESASYKMAILLEHSAREILSRDCYTDTIKGMILPIVRRTYGLFVEREDFTVMTLPCDLYFYDEYKNWPVVAKTKRFSTQWTKELDDDLHAIPNQDLHAYDVGLAQLDKECDVSEILSEELSREIESLLVEGPMVMYIPLIIGPLIPMEDGAEPFRAMLCRYARPYTYATGIPEDAMDNSK